MPKQVQVQVLLVFGLESQRWTVAEASFNTWWGKAQDMTVARHRAWHQDGVQEWSGSWERQSNSGSCVFGVLSALGAFPECPPSRGRSLGGWAGVCRSCQRRTTLLCRKDWSVSETGFTLELLYKEGWFLTTSTLKLEIQGEEAREEISGGFKLAEPGMAATHPDFQFPAFFLLAPFPEHW